ncbi:MAG: helix-turn-helix domain-containing protein [Solirubrobacterales bacterium]|nr:helix-turn-helix domain-containing protein [Solirubrobacterales bacterium]
MSGEGREGGRGGPPGTLGTVRNAVMLLDLLSQGPAHQQLTDLAERSDLSLPTAHRLLRSLAVAGLVEQDPVSQRYSLGQDLVRLSERYLARLSVLRGIAPYLVELRRSLGETVLAALLTGGWIVYVDRLEGGQDGGIYREPGRIEPALETAAGRLLVARGGKRAWVEAAQNGSPLAAAELAGLAEAPHLTLTRPPDRWEVAAPVVSPAGAAPAAIAISGSRERNDEDWVRERVVPSLLRAAEAVSRGLADG